MFGELPYKIKLVYYKNPKLNYVVPALTGFVYHVVPNLSGLFFVTNSQESILEKRSSKFLNLNLILVSGIGFWVFLGSRFYICGSVFS